MKKFILLFLLASAARADVTGHAVLVADATCVVTNLQATNASTVTAQLSGTWVGSVTFKGSTDKGATYANMPSSRASTVAPTVNGIYDLRVGGYSHIEACFTRTSGSVTVDFFGTTGVLAGSPTGTAGGDLGGSYPNPTVTSVADVTAGQLAVLNGGSGTGTGGITTAKLATPVMTASLGTCTGSTSCTGGSFIHGNTIYFTVTATNSAGETLAATECSKAAGACSGADTSTITINWGAVPGATAYNVYYGGTGAEAKETAAIGTTATTYTSTGSATSGALPTRNSTADEVHVGITGAGSVTTAALPATCSNGAMAWDSTASALKVCSANAWSAVGGFTAGASASYYASASQNLPSGAFTVINFDTSNWDTASAVTTGAAWHFTTPTTGKYRLTGNVGLVGTTNKITTLILTVYKGGAEFARISQITTGTGQNLGTNSTASGSIEMILTAADVIDFRVGLVTVGAVTFPTDTGNGTTNCSITRIPGI